MNLATRLRLVQIVTVAKVLESHLGAKRAFGLTKELIGMLLSESERECSAANCAIDLILAGQVVLATPKRGMSFQ